MRYAITLALLLISTALFCQQEKYARIKIDMHGRTRAALAELGLDVEHGGLQPDVSYIGEFSETEQSTIRQAGFSYTVLIDDLAAYIVAQNRRSNDVLLRGGSCGDGFYPIKTPRNYRYGSMGGYVTYTEMLAVLDSMRVLYPNLITAKTPISTTLKSIEGRPLHWLRISQNADTEDRAKPQVLYTALHHAREPNSLSQMIFYMWYLLENYATDPEIKFLVDNTSLYFVPCMNPDGYVYNETSNPNGGGFWRKNRRKNADNTYGVDLNRNYGYQWGINNIGSSNATNSETYRGTAPFSEPETDLIRQFCNSHSFQLCMNYHTFSNDLIYPWSYNDTPTPDAPIFNTITELMTRDNNFVTGTTVQTLGYNVNGDADDWMYGEQSAKSKIFALTPEIGSPNYDGFWPLRDAIMNLNKSCLHMNIVTAEVVHNYGLATDATPQYIPSKTGNFKFKIKRYGLKNGDLKVSIRSGSANLTTVTTVKTYTLTQGQAITDSLSYTLLNTIKEGEEVVFLLSVNNGIWMRTDTIRKIYGTPTLAFNQSGASLTEFQNTTTWGTTTGRFYSAPTSITDSPSGNYPTFSLSNITTKTPILIPTNATKAVLRFRTYWEIMPTYSYVTPSVELNGSNNFQAICGKLTRNHPITNEPVYDGIQTRWLEEEFDLTAFAGKSVRWRFALTTSGQPVADGFYFDDMILSISTPTGTATQSLEAADFSISQNHPNPTANVTTIDIDFEQQKHTSAKLIVTDISGKIIFEKPLQSIEKQEIVLNTEGWAAGVYAYYLDLDNGRFKTQAKRLVVAR
jgi:carboxypeptidase T